MVATKAVKEALWLEGLVCDLGASPKDMMMFWDSQSTFIYFYQCKEVYNSTKWTRSLDKHNSFNQARCITGGKINIDIRLHFTCDVIAEGELLMKKITTSYNLVD